MPDTVMQTETAQEPTRSKEIKDLAAALVKAQAVMDGAKKKATNPHFDRKYADLSSVWDAIREPLTTNDLCIVQFPRTSGNGVEIETTMIHGKTGQYMRDVLWVPCSKNDAQGLGSAITYGRRYSLMSIVGIAPEDDDGNAAVAGTAGGGGDFRPAGPRRFSMDKAKGETDAPNGGGAPKAKDAPVPDNAIKRVEWVKASVSALKAMDKAAATDWWASEKKRIGVIETALPTEYERLLDAYNEALDRGEAA